MIRPDAYLLDMCAPVYDVDQHLADRPVCVVDNDPRPFLLRAPCELLAGCRLIVRHLEQADLAETVRRQGV